ncbi:MAG: hemerythrin domain-containing protein [Alphaproteobacteria bacterium]
MDGFEWSPTFEIGVPEIDDDHRHLFDLAREIQAAVEEGEPAKCRALVEGFIDASQSHFAAEERFLARIRYEEFETHRKYHASLVTKARKLKQSCDEATRRGEVAECYLEVVGFLIDDILRGDIKLKSYFNHHGPSRQK